MTGLWFIRILMFFSWSTRLGFRENVAKKAIMPRGARQARRFRKLGITSEIK